MKLGTISELYRYPVKSLRGEALTEIMVSASGFAGDRLWAFRDTARNEITSAKRSPLLLQMAASFTDAGAKPRARLSLPNGESFDTDAADCNDRVSAYIGRELAVYTVRPASDAAHYARAATAPEHYEASIRELLGLLADEPFPDFSKLPPEALKFTTVPGTYFDASPISIILASELRRLQNGMPDAAVEALRFRPNIVLNDLDNPLTSEGLVGARLKIGDAEMTAIAHTPRCSMVTHAQDRLPKAPQIMRTLVRDWKHNFGLYISVQKAGHIRIGDTIERL